MIGKVLGHYRIVERIGVGGMGEVYRARDEQLDRDVALKVLPQSALVNQLTRKRLRKEALALSKLSHPNIEFLYEFNSEGPVEFMAVEYVPGTTFSEMLTEGPLPEKKTIRLGVQLADGLAAAHTRGVVHCDLKPGNLRITPEGRLKIIDFGIAKLLRPTGRTAGIESTTLSTNGNQTPMGTLPYMAPEQLRSEATDGRTDIYAAGAILYEAATGRRPFGAEVAPPLTDAILHQPPVLPRALNSRISAELERIILKCLQKEPENRYQSAQELELDLQQLTGSGTAAPVPVAAWNGTWRRKVCMAVVVVLVVAALVAGLKVGGWWGRLQGKSNVGRIESLAVLPLQNLSGDPEQDYFADGMTDELITDMAHIRALRVISRTSAMQYKGTRKSLKQIARELNVDAVVEGSVLRSGDRVRISAQLIEAATDRHLWAESYERDLRDILALQSEVSEDIANEIRITITPQERARLAGAQRVDPEAYESYLKGRYYWNRRTQHDIERSIEYFQRAIARTPAYAPAYAGLADAYHVLWVYSDVPPREMYLKARTAARKALEIDNTLAEAHTSLAAIMADDEWDFAGAEKEFRRAIELNSNYATAHQWFAECLTYVGRFEEAIIEIQRAQVLDPFSLVINDVAGEVFIRAGQYDRAISQLKRTIEIERDFWLAHIDLRDAYLGKGMFKEALVEGQIAATLAGETPEEAAQSAAVLREAYANSGEKGYWRKRLDFAKLSMKKGRALGYDGSPYRIACIYAHLGERDLTYQWLKRALEERDVSVAYLQTAPEFEDLRSDPRATELMKLMGLPQ